MKNTQIFLTPNEGKQLIADALASLDFVQEAMREHTVVVVMGTTNAYLANALLSQLGEEEIDMNDVRIDVMRASGNGGQCVNTTDSAVRLTHMPTGIVIYSQTEKSQLQNKDKAFRLLRSKLYGMELQRRQAEEAAERRSQIGTGDRSEKIRTYNFPQGRVTEHRIKLTLYKIDQVMNGDIEEIIDALTAAYQAEKLSRMEKE